MAQIVWKKDASDLLEKHIDYALTEFGRKTVKRWYLEIKNIESRMSIHPESFSLEPLLKKKTIQYRGAVLMKNFKLIHYYDSSVDTVYIITIWDMRMSPSKLERRV